MTINLTLIGPPRTAKNSPMMIAGRSVLLPSEPYRDWCKHQLLRKQELKARLGELIPIKTKVSIAAAIYREKEAGDVTGFYQAIADVLQSSVFQCVNPLKHGAKNACHKKTVSDIPLLRCPHCDWPAPKIQRRGLGIYLDDRLVRDWDGSRPYVDKTNPRVELVITVLEEEEARLKLLQKEAAKAMIEDMFGEDLG